LFSFIVGEIEKDDVVESKEIVVVVVVVLSTRHAAGFVTR